ncbi:thymidine kinase [Aquisalinus flavus]|uniref:Thymidine kinase n=1 Tax=Aquisalinus flavus TaxID=1526572 RepID=A0A8J2Y609_9PROT|nr:thymidine kinase [Aquisalinus flavus]MBD0426918.1 thymidine kinase [Aquisalinus flavus]UNE46761.1 thymidine kinase [Aquisalinus flavus]GGC96971.1 thymidine kinase [Aquisalinus flavus]
MAKLYFSYSAMNAGKSTILLQAAYNYRERGMVPVLFTAAIDKRGGEGKIASRIGLDEDALMFDDSHNLFAWVESLMPCHCVMIDEAQFLTETQVWQLARVTDDLGIPVMTFGLRTDFAGKLFPGSATLLAIADTVREIRTICWCGRKATMVLRIGADGRPVLEGDQVAIGGNESYVSLCRKHWRGQLAGPDEDE